MSLSYIFFLGGILTIYIICYLEIFYAAFNNMIFLVIVLLVILLLPLLCSKCVGIPIRNFPIIESDIINNLYSRNT